MTIADLRARIAAHARFAEVVPSLEDLLTSRDYFALLTATPLQRAITRVADGRPLGPLADHPDVLRCIGDVSALPSRPPSELCLLSGIRGGKSLMAAAGGLRMALTCDVSRLGVGEVPRVSIISLKLDLAEVVYGHLVGALTTQPKLRAYMVGTPTADAVTVRHPSGKLVEIKVVAGARAGGSIVARWMAGVIFDEAPRMVGSSDGVVNLDDMRSNAVGRLLAGAQIWCIGSPWAPFGPVYEMVSQHWLKPTARLVVVRAPAPLLNPVHWTPERIAALKASDPGAYKTDILAEFADPEEALLPTQTIEACMGVEEPPQRGHSYCAAMDPATRGNAWTLVIATRRDGKRRVVRVRQWQGSKVAPLDPEAVFAEIAAELGPYRVESVETDQWSGDALRVIARAFGLSLDEWPLTAADNAAGYLELARRMSLGEVVVPPDPALKADLQRLKKRVTQNGIAIDLPLTADGRHCDYAPAVMRAVRRYVDEPKAPIKPSDEEEHEVFERARAKYAPAAARPAWGRGGR